MIRPFRAGDIFLIQPLSRQVTRLNTVHALLQSHSVLQAALMAVIPWNEAKVVTYVLHQRSHELARVGFLQAQKRPGRPEADVLLLAPALDTPLGHPAAWQKLLVHYCNEAAQQQLARIYVDAPDQPLPINTLSQVGFRVYTHQTIWRLVAGHGKLPALASTSLPARAVSSIRLPTAQDEWALRRLYTRVTPNQVQQAEGVHPDNPIYKAVKPPILEWWQAGMRQSYVYEKKGELQGCIRLTYGKRGIWLQLWAETQHPNNECIEQLLRHALAVVQETNLQLPIYIGVRDYHGGLGAVLAEYGFAPFTDRAKMVKHVVQWVRAAVPSLAPALETIREVAPIPFALPDELIRLNYTEQDQTPCPLLLPRERQQKGET